MKRDFSLFAVIARKGGDGTNEVNGFSSAQGLTNLAPGLFALIAR
jgi:hypothetical protein